MPWCMALLFSCIPLNKLIKMKVFTVVLIIILYNCTGFAQTNQNFDRSGSIPWLMQDDMTARVNNFIDNNHQILNKDQKIEGSVFVNEQWNNGYVKLPDGRMAANLPLRFNAYTNQIHFLKDSAELTLTINVREFGYSFGNNLAEQQVTLFRNGFPSISKQDSLSFYEVLVGGNISLVKYHSKILRQITPITGITAYKIDDADVLYLFFKNKNEMALLKKDRDYITSLLTAKEAVKFNELVNENGFKLKSEKDFIILVTGLNK